VFLRQVVTDMVNVWGELPGWGSMCCTRSDYREEVYPIVEITSRLTPGLYLIGWCIATDEQC